MDEERLEADTHEEHDEAVEKKLAIDATG